MIEQLHEKISVLAVFNRSGSIVSIFKLKWQNRIYLIKKMAYAYKRRDGRNITHVFHVNNDTIHFKLSFDTEFLTWWIEEVSDGNTN